MATYNWSLRPNIYNYWLSVVGVVDETDEDVCPNNYAYVALWGNDVIGNGSRMKPFRTIARAIIERGSIILGAGVYRENIPYNLSYIMADGDVILDMTFCNFFGQPQMFGVKIRNAGISVGYITLRRCIDFQIDGSSNGVMNFYNGHQRNILSNFAYISMEDASAPNSSYGYNTFLNIQRLDISSSPTAQVSLNHCIFVDCNFGFNYPPNFDYCIFYNCKFRRGGDDEYELIDNLEDLQEFIQSIFPEAIGVYSHCKFFDPKFNNPEIGDYSLAFDSPAKNLSYFGTPVGAQSIGYPIKASALEADGDFDFSTINNLVVANNSITLDDPELDASIETVVKPNLIGRELGRAPIYGFNADRNGQYIDSIADLSNVVIEAGTDLVDQIPYLVEISAITYDGNVLQAGERFTAKTVLEFTSEGGGVCREIVEAPQRHTILARFSNGGASITSVDPFVSGNWYYVSGTITYNGDDYTDKIFKAIDTNSFTGLGSVMEAITDEVYQHYEPGIKFTSNNVGDVRTGEIIRGNGDPDYERGAGKEFPINARFIQLKYIIRVNNLKP